MIRSLLCAFAASSILILANCASTEKSAEPAQAAEQTADQAEASTTEQTAEGAQATEAHKDCACKHHKDGKHAHKHDEKHGEHNCKHCAHKHGKNEECKDGACPLKKENKEKKSAA